VAARATPVVDRTCTSGEQDRWSHRGTPSSSCGFLCYWAHEQRWLAGPRLDRLPPGNKIIYACARLDRGGVGGAVGPPQRTINVLWLAVGPLPTGTKPGAIQGLHWRPAWSRVGSHLWSLWKCSHATDTGSVS